MEKLANITQNDINNGVLNRMLASAGISDVQEYVQLFQQQIENKVIEDLEQSEANAIDNDEQIAPPADVQSWITGLRLRLDDPIIPPTVEPPKQQQPTDLKSWMNHMTPINLSTSTDTTSTQTTTITTTTTTTITSNNESAVNGNLGIWLNDWSKSLAEQPPPTSLDTWLQGLVSQNMHDPIGKATNSKGRLNTYLNAAQDVLSEHGYHVSNEVTPPTSVEAKTGMFGNVKQMYFLVSFFFILSQSHSLLRLIYFSGKH